ncbi:hypothetical protein G5I_13806 [Acromyrmex echinatior]|uniref:Uncharacterized protein n=1 Tax=Acromyrmex echinatior TaxID=103372 RepID=F4X610_ACREC|nr:hypothetical protein G5I_13806 [Acromyrmex echinatior]
MVDFIAYPEISYLYDEFMMTSTETTSCNDLASERGNVSREVRVVERVNPHHEVELLYRNITLIRRLMNDGPSSVRVPRLNLIRALNLPGREHDGIPCRSRCVRQRLPSVAVTAGKRGGMGVGKSSDGTAVRTRGLGKGRLFALRTTEQIRHADDDVDDSSRADCHANHGTERPVIDSRRPFSSLPRFTFSSRRVGRKPNHRRRSTSHSRFSVGAVVQAYRKFDQTESSFRYEIRTASSSTVQSSFTADRPFYGEPLRKRLHVNRVIDINEKDLKLAPNCPKFPKKH